MTDYSRDFQPAEWGPIIIFRGNNPQDRMSALGQKQTLGNVAPMSALPPIADIAVQKERDRHKHAQIAVSGHI
jgi:hypothetical protein